MGHGTDPAPGPAPSRPAGWRATGLWIAGVVADLTAAVLLVRAVARATDLPTIVAGSTWLRYSALHWILPVTWTAALVITGSQRPSRNPRLGEELTNVTRAAVGTLALIAAVSLATELNLSRAYVGTSLIGLVGVAVGLRIILLVFVRALHRRGQFTERVLLVGAAGDAAPIATHLATGRGSGFVVVGTVTPPAGSADQVGAPDAGLAEVLAAVTAREATTVIIAGTQMFSPGGVRRVATQLSGLGITVLIAPEIDEFGGPGVSPQPVADLMLLRARSARPSWGERASKMALDRLGALVLLLATLPVMAVLAVILRLDSKGPIVFRQRRVGRRGSTFTIYKFRSMVADAEQRLHDDGLYEAYVENGFKLPSDDDPRITRFGRFLRRSSLDELPQLFNVVRGSMSLVGPRPVVAADLERYGQYADAYLELRPGMTGYWQVNGRSNNDLPERAALDAFYACNRSLKLDLLILSRTVLAVVRRDGAQ